MFLPDVRIGPSKAIHAEEGLDWIGSSGSSWYEQCCQSYLTFGGMMHTVKGARAVGHLISSGRESTSTPAARMRVMPRP